MTTATTTVLASTLANAQATIKGLLHGQEVAAENFAKTSRQHTADVAGHLVVLGRTLLADENKSDFAALIVSKRIQYRATANPWSYVIQLAIENSDKTAWKNRGPALRALDGVMTNLAAATGRVVTADDVSDTVGKFDLQEWALKCKDEPTTKAIGKANGTRLDGLAKLDALLNRDENAPTDAKLLETATAAEALNLNDKTDIKSEFVMVWARVQDGVIIPMGIVNKGEGEARKAAIAAGRKLLEQPTPEQLAQTIETKVGDLVYGDELGSTTQPAEVREEGEPI